MPRNGAEVYSKPANTTAVSGQTIESAKYNQTIDDIVDDLNLDRPVEAGGTGASNATDARSNLLAATKRTRSTKAANYTAQVTDDGAWFEATAAITLSFAAAATLGNRWECLVFANGGDVTLDPNSTETINGAATLVIEDGDAALIHCTGATLHAVTVQAPFDYTPADEAITVTGAGLATGGGDLTANRTITVTAASQAEAEAGTSETVVMTPLRTAQAITEVSLGQGQTWQNVTASRVGSFTSYQNTTGRPIGVSISSPTNGALQVSTNNSTWVEVADASTAAGISIFTIVPADHYYRFAGATIDNWAELR